MEKTFCHICNVWEKMHQPAAIIAHCTKKKKKEEEEKEEKNKNVRGVENGHVQVWAFVHDLV